MSTLNFDILISVVTHLSSKDALYVSSASKATRAYVVCKILSRGVVLTTCEQMTKFPEFIMADSPNRLPHLRELRAEVYYSIQHLSCVQNEQQSLPLHNFASFLTHLLTHTRHLRVLSLFLSGYFLSQHSDLRDALVQYDGLNELTLYDTNEDALNTVNFMRSPLQVLSIWRDDMNLFGMPQLGSFLQYITSHRHLQKIQFYSRDNGLAWDFDDPSQWHGVRDLKISGTAAPLGTLVAAFPNLRSLRISEVDASANDSPSSAQWTCLDYLRGDCAHLCQWHIQCPIRWLDLPMTNNSSYNIISSNLRSNGAYRFPSAANFINLLEWTKPVILTFTASYDTGTVLWENLVPVISQVKLLELTIWFGSLVKDEDDSDEEDGVVETHETIETIEEDDIDDDQWLCTLVPQWIVSLRLEIDMNTEHIGSLPGNYTTIARRSQRSISVYHFWHGI